MHLLRLLHSIILLHQLSFLGGRKGLFVVYKLKLAGFCQIIIKITICRSAQFEIQIIIKMNLYNPNCWYIWILGFSLVQKAV